MVRAITTHRKRWATLTLALAAASGLAVAGLRGRAEAADKPAAAAESAKGAAEVPKLEKPKPFKPLKPNANAAVRSVAEASKLKKHPERLSASIRPAPFDPKAFAADPDAYLNAVVPGRVWRVAQPGPGVPAVGVVGEAYHRVPPSGAAELAVQVPPLAPATFTSFDLGAFQNGLTSVTVRAGADGVARATFTAVDGTSGDVNILAACPLTAGQAEFLVSVTR